MLALLSAALLAAAPSPRHETAAAPPRPFPPASEVAEARAAQLLARLADGEPGVEEVQRAAAAGAQADPEELEGWRRRAGRAAWLPRLSAEVRREDRTYRIFGLTGSGEVDYLRAAPGSVAAVRAVWDLDALIFSADEVRAAEAAARLLRHRDDLVTRATRLYFRRQRLRAALVLSPPEDAAERADRELALDEMTAELDALTAGLFRRGRPR